jgi:hypothetical protein
MLASLFNMRKQSAWFTACALLISSAAACGEPGIVEKHRIKGSETPPPPPDDDDADGGVSPDTGAPPGPCPSGWTCMDLAARGFMATDGDGNPVTASCSMGAAATTCDDADPAATCAGLSEPFCAHLKLGAQEIVSCAQRCTP